MLMSGTPPWLCHRPRCRCAEPAVELAAVDGVARQLRVAPGRDRGRIRAGHRDGHVAAAGDHGLAVRHDGDGVAVAAGSDVERGNGRILRHHPRGRAVDIHSDGGVARRARAGAGRRVVRDRRRADPCGAVQQVQVHTGNRVGGHAARGGLVDDDAVAIGSDAVLPVTVLSDVESLIRIVLRPSMPAIWLPDEVPETLFT